MNVLQKLNAMRKRAKELGVKGYNTMKMVELEAVIAEAEAKLVVETPKPTPAPSDDDPFYEGPDSDDDAAEDTSPEARQAEAKVTREAWLMDAVDALRPLLKQAGADVPERIAVSVGFAGSGRANKTLGECWAIRSSEGGQVNHIFISPVMSDTVDVLATLVHELIHASDDCRSGHKGFFARVARIVGLEGKLTKTHAGPELATALKEIASELGDYPHIKLNLSVGRKKQTTRLIKLSHDHCGTIIRTTSKWLTVWGEAWPCPCGDGNMHTDAYEGDED